MSARALPRRARLPGCIRVLAAGLLFLSVSAVAAPAEAEIRIATEGAYPPFNYVENGQPAGFEVDLGRALCAAMRTPCVFVLQEWDELHAGLKAMKYDAVMSSMEITAERRTRYLFSQPYYRIPATLISRKDEPDGSDPDASLAGRTVGVVAGSEFARYLEGLPQPPDIRRYAKLEEAELDLLTERIDFVLGDKLAIAPFLGSREGKGCCRALRDPPVDRGEGVAVALRKGDRDLAARFDAAIAEIRADGTYDRIRSRYFPFDIN